MAWTAVAENDSMVLIDGKPWSPTNYDGSYGGTYSMAGALKRSMNIPTVNLYFEVGFEKLVETWKNLGFTAKLKDRPVTALGPADASLYEAAVAYAAFANGGYRVQPYLIESISTSSGEEIYRHKVKTFKRVLLERTVALMNAMLRGVILDGTGKRILNYGFGGYMAGKTGTSQNYADAWFIGYTRKIVMASRVGASTPQIHFSTGMGSGSSLALPLVGITLGKVSYQSVGKSWKQGFDSLPEHLQDEMDCPDYLEDSLLQEWLNQLIDEDSTGDDAEKKANRRKKIREFMKNVFGKESEED
jgi:penicillin-binding protein 1A